jgi:hypothetical protein
MSKDQLRAAGWVAMALAAVWYAQSSHVRAADPHTAGLRPAISHAQSPHGAPADPVTLPDRALLDKYCVTCHNDKLKTGGLTLDRVDFTDVKGN